MSEDQFTSPLDLEILASRLREAIMDFAIPLVNDALGGNVIYDEYKGDFALARKVAEQNLLEADTGHKNLAGAQALFACGVIHLLQGNCASSLALLQEIESTDPAGSVLLHRALSYTNWAAFGCYNMFPGGTGANSLEIAARWNGLAFMNQQHRKRIALSGQRMNPELQLERSLVDLLCNVLPLRSSLETAANLPQSTVSSILDVALQSVAAFRDEAEAAGASPKFFAYADVLAADFFRRARQVESARELLARATSTYLDARDFAGAGACHMLRGDWLAAPLSTPSALNLVIRESGSAGSELQWTVEAEEFDGDFVAEEAQPAYAESAKLFQEAGAARGLAAIQLREAYLDFRNEDYETAVEKVTEARESFNRLGDELGYWVAAAHQLLGRIGITPRDQDHHVAQAIGDWGKTRGSFSYALGLGILFCRAGRQWLVSGGDFERSLACHGLATALFDALGAPLNSGQAVADQGVVHAIIGDRPASIANFEDALSKYVAIAGQRPEFADLIRQRAVWLGIQVCQLYEQGKDFAGMEQAARHLRQHVDAVHASPGEDAGSVASTYLAELALATLEQTETMAALYRGLRARESGKVTDAQLLLSEAFSLARGARSTSSDFLEAVVLAHREERQQARKAFERYLGRGGANFGFLGQAAESLAKIGKTGEAEARIQEERTHEQAASFLLRVKAFDESWVHFVALEQLGGPDWWRRTERPWETLSDYGELQEGRNRLLLALRYFEVAIDELEIHRRLLSRDQYRVALASLTGAKHLYFGAARAALRTKEKAQRGQSSRLAGVYAAKAFGYAERGKGRALLDLMAGSTEQSAGAHPEDHALFKCRQLNAQLTTWRGLLAHMRQASDLNVKRTEQLERRIQDDEAKLRALERHLSTLDHGLDKATGTQAEILSLSEISAKLAPGIAILQYYFLADQLLAWAVTQEGIVESCRSQVKASDLNLLVTKIHDACESQLSTDELGKKLADTLLTPLRHTILNNARLIVAPYGSTHCLPFHILPWEGQPLAASHIVSYLPSASALRFLKPSSLEALSSIRAVGHPARMAFQEPGGDTVVVDPLPYTATEATYVASLFPQRSVLLDEDATAEKVGENVSEFSVLHFATHGLLREDSPLLSSLLLANGGALSAYEMMGLRLRAELVVLSACNTAQGEVTGGDDVMGLTRAILAGGAHAAIVSLWRVSDLSTSLLMGEFYRHLKNSKMPALALNRAQDYLRKLKSEEIPRELDRLRGVLENAGAGRVAIDPVTLAVTERRSKPKPITPGLADYGHPFFWAPFILVGW